MTVRPTQNNKVDPPAIVMVSYAQTVGALKKCLIIVRMRLPGQGAKQTI